MLSPGREPRRWRYEERLSPRRGRQLDSPGCEPRILRYIIDGHPA